MLWFFRKDTDALRLETLFDNATQEYVAILHQPDGSQHAERFKDPATFRSYLLDMERRLEAARWEPDGGPIVLPDGWPDSKL